MELGNGTSPQAINKIVTVGDTFTVSFEDVQSCPAFVKVTYSIGDDPAQTTPISVRNVPPGAPPGRAARPDQPPACVARQPASACRASCGRSRPVSRQTRVNAVLSASGVVTGISHTKPRHT